MRKIALTKQYTEFVSVTTQLYLENKVYASKEQHFHQGQVILKLITILKTHAGSTIYKY
jgi:hypothetical protein